MSDVPRHRHDFSERLFEETGKVDRRGKITVFTTWGCSFRGCTKTRRTRKKNTYWTISKEW